MSAGMTAMDAVESRHDATCPRVLRKICQCWHWDEKIRWGRDSQQLQRPRALEVRTVELLEPQGRAFLRSTRCTRRSKEPKREHRVSVKAVRMTPRCGGP